MFFKLFLAQINLVQNYLDKGEQVLFFINRRGFAPYLICKKCGYKKVCSNCSMYLTFHKKKNKAICHHCSAEKEMYNKCKEEGYCNFIMFGPGVEKIFKTYSRGVSSMRIAPRDTVARRTLGGSLAAQPGRALQGNPAHRAASRYFVRCCCREPVPGTRGGFLAGNRF